MRRPWVLNQPRHWRATAAPVLPPAMLLPTTSVAAGMGEALSELPRGSRAAAGMPQGRCQHARALSRVELITKGEIMHALTALSHSSCTTAYAKINLAALVTKNATVGFLPPRQSPPPLGTIASIAEIMALTVLKTDSGKSDLEAQAQLILSMLSPTADADDSSDNDDDAKDQKITGDVLEGGNEWIPVNGDRGAKDATPLAARMINPVKTLEQNDRSRLPPATVIMTAIAANNRLRTNSADVSACSLLDPGHGTSWAEGEGPDKTGRANRVKTARNDTDARTNEESGTDNAKGRTITVGSTVGGLGKLLTELKEGSKGTTETKETE